MKSIKISLILFLFLLKVRAKKYCAELDPKDTNGATGYLSLEIGIIIFRIRIFFPLLPVIFYHHKSIKKTALLIIDHT